MESCSGEQPLWGNRFAGVLRRTAFGHWEKLRGIEVALTDSRCKKQLSIAGVALGSSFWKPLLETIFRARLSNSGAIGSRFAEWLWDIFW